jgi:DNA-binding PadR family transcriptional regulator
VTNLAQPLYERLFADEAAHVYAVLDGASVEELLPKLYDLEPEFECLYRGELEPDMAEVAPYLVRLEPETEFADWVLEEGWGRHWGVFAVTDAGLRELHKHFRSFLTVYDPDGKPLLFRYYDPRVLRVYLPTCDAGELRTVFGPVSCYLLEDQEPNTLLRFQLNGDALRREAVKLAEDADE